MQYENQETLLGESTELVQGLPVFHTIKCMYKVPDSVSTCEDLCNCSHSQRAEEGPRRTSGAPGLDTLIHHHSQLSETGELLSSYSSLTSRKCCLRHHVTPILLRLTLLFSLNPIVLTSSKLLHASMVLSFSLLNSTL